MNIAVFASGRGTNFQEILKSIDSGFLSARVVLLLSNRPDAGALDIARSRGIACVHLSRLQCSSDEEFTQRMLAALQVQHAEFIALAGYLKRIPPPVIEQYANRIVNIHPALLPFFGGSGMYGHFVHEAVLASGMKISGAPFIWSTMNTITALFFFKRVSRLSAGKRLKRSQKKF